jgi:hypothetical protein
MKKYGGAGVTELSFLTMALDEGEWSTYHAPAAPPPPRERAPGTHYTRGHLGPKAGLESMEKIKMSYPCQESNLNFSATKPVARAIYKHICC